MLQLVLNNYEFNYLEAGKGDSLVFVHGSASDYRTWNNQFNTFNKQFHTIVYSRRYHYPNRQIAEDQDYSMMQHVSDLEALILNLANPPVHLIAHSYGGFMALLLAIKNPALIKSLILTEPPVITLYVSNQPRPSELFELLLKRPKLAMAILKFGIKGISPATAAIKDNDAGKALAIFGKATLGDKTFLKLSKSRLEKAGENFIATELTGSGFPHLDRCKIQEIQAPTLLLSGEKSRKLFHYLLDGLEGLIPKAERVLVSNASHIVHEDNPSGYNDVIRTFLQKNGA